MNLSLPKISIITATYNAEVRVFNCIKSVYEQTYPNIEHIIIDGASTDNTVDIIQQNIEKISYFVSEPDKGISDAFNKGIKAATGDYIYFLGADDHLYSNTSIMSIFGDIDNFNYDIICGKIARITEDGSKVLWTSVPVFFKHSLLIRMSLPHQATFTHKRFFEKYGLFRHDIKFSMDYEILLRAYKTFPEVKMVDSFVACWRAGGIGQGKIIDVYNEYHQIKREHNIAPFFILFLIRMWIYLKYIIRYKILFFYPKY